MTLVSDLVEEVRRMLLSGAGETLNQLASLAGTSGTSLVLSRELRNVAAGSVLSVGTETLYVWAVTDPVSKTVEVQRGYGGSTAATHAAGDLVRVNPPHPDFGIFAALNAEIDALTGAGLYAMKTLDLTASSTGVRAYNLTSPLLDVYDVRYDADETANTWPEVSSWTWEAGMPTTEFASGNMLRLDTTVPSGRTMRVRYKAPLTRLTALTDDVAAVSGLAATATDILPLGACWRLQAPAEIDRTSTRRQGDSRRAEEVPPGSKLRATALIVQRYQQRVAAERGNLDRLWPGRRRR